MRRFFTIIATSLFFVGTLALFAGSPAHAEDLTPDQTERVKANCVSIKTSLSQLHTSDALLRVNRGQVYLSLANNLMDTFNARLGSNRLDNRAMVTSATNYRSTFRDFYNNYISYEQKLAETLRTDCVAQPNTFYNLLQEARELRLKVHGDVQRLHQHIDDYRTSVSAFLLNYERVSN